MAQRLLHILVVAFCLIYSLPLTIPDDSILYSINWPGENFDLEGSTKNKYNKADAVVVRTENNEQYECMIPSSVSEKNIEGSFSDAKSPVELLSPLLVKKACTYRLEAYWSYEICHGKHIRQYHEEKTSGGGIKVQEYFLGYFKGTPDDKGLYKNLGNIPKTADEIPTKKIDGIQTPYYKLEMTDGTTCALKGGNKRKTQVIYVCHPESKNEIMSITETSSCEYEVVVLTPTLCENPFYKIKGNPTNEIYCNPLAGSPTTPKALAEQNAEQSAEFNAVRATRKAVSISDETEVPLDSQKDEYRRIENMDISLQTDKALLKEFLSGDFCLKGNSGWWSYEFCYGKYVKQYHDDKTLGRTTIMVGFWDESAHKNWAKGKNARVYRETFNQQTNKNERKVYRVEHFYHKGDFCDAVKKSREVIVRLKCKQSSSKHSVTIYLREPSTCSYILGVESPIICDLLDTADADGLFDMNL